MGSSGWDTGGKVSFWTILLSLLGFGAYKKFKK